MNNLLRCDSFSRCVRCTVAWMSSHTRADFCLKLLVPCAIMKEMCGHELPLRH